MFSVSGINYQSAIAVHNFEKMPTEIISNIFLRIIDPSSTTIIKGLASISLVSKTFKSVADATKRLYMSISCMSLEKIHRFGFEKYMITRTLTNQIEVTTLVNAMIGGYYGGFSYEETLGENINTMIRVGSLFINDLATLQATDTWVDVGCGDGLALTQCLSLYPDGPNIVGISATCPSEKSIGHLIKLATEEKRFSYYLCDFNAFPTSALEGRVSLVTDIIGAFRYGKNPARFIEQAGRLLKSGGKLYIQYCYSDQIHIPQFPNITSSINGSSSHHLLHIWFYTIKGFDVIQPGMTLEESRAFRHRCIQEASNYLTTLRQESPGPQISRPMFDARLKSLTNLTVNFDEGRMILQRNDEPVQADTLIANPFFSCEEAEKQRNWDQWYPNYEWVMSDESKSIIENTFIYLSR